MHLSLTQLECLVHAARWFHRVLCLEGCGFKSQPAFCTSSLCVCCPFGSPKKILLCGVCDCYSIKWDVLLQKPLKII